MSKSLLMIGCLALGAAGGFAASLVAGSPAPPAPPPAADRAAPAVSATDLGRIQRRLDELSAAIQSRGAVAAAASAAPSAPGEAAAPADASMGDRVAALEKRLTALEKGMTRVGPVVPENLAPVPSKELDGLARNLVQLKRYDEAQRVLKEVLGRTDLDEEQRTEMEMQQGYSLRGLSRNADAEARFLETMRRVGEDTDKGAWAGFQVGWERYYQKDLAGASARMERSANATGVGAIVRVHSLYNAANFAKEAGDPVRARTLLERLLNQHAGDIPESQAFMKKQAETWLKEVRGF